MGLVLGLLGEYGGRQTAVLGPKGEFSHITWPLEVKLACLETSL